MRQKALELEKGGVSPLDFLLGIMGSVRNTPAMRLEAAKAAAPYVHARLQAVTLAGDPENPLEHNHHLPATDAERAAAIVAMFAKTKD